MSGAEIARLIQPKTFAEALEIAAKLAESDLVPRAYQKKPANIVLAWEMGAELGLSPMQSIQSIAVINGKPSIYGDVGLALVLASGLIEGLPVEEDDGEVASCTVTRKGCEPVTRTYSMAEARSAQMYERDANGNGKWLPLAERATWRSFPKRMRQMRARWWALHDAFPDVLKGVGIVEVQRDLGDPEAHLADAEPAIETERVGETYAPPPLVAESPTAERVTRRERPVEPRTQREVEPPPREPELIAVEPLRPTEVVKAPPLEEPVQTEIGEPAPPARAVNAPAPKEKPRSAAAALRAVDEKQKPAPPPLVVEQRAGSPASAVSDAGVVAPAGKTLFVLNGAAYETNGITREQFLEAAQLVLQLDRLAGRGTAKALLASILGVAVSDPRCHRTFLDEAGAARWIAELTEKLATFTTT